MAEPGEADVTTQYVHPLVLAVTLNKWQTIKLFWPDCLVLGSESHLNRLRTLAILRGTTQATLGYKFIVTLLIEGREVFIVENEPLRRRHVRLPTQQS